MASIEEKQIAKEIVIEILKNNGLLRDEYPEAETVTDMVCSAYSTILKTISSGK